MCVDIYNDRKQNLLQEKIVDIAQDLQDRADAYVTRLRTTLSSASFFFCYRELRTLNLPSALEALERPIGLPPSLLRKAEEVRLEDGPAKIEASIEAVKRLAHQDFAILEEVGFAELACSRFLNHIRPGFGYSGRRSV